MKLMKWSAIGAIIGMLIVSGAWAADGKIGVIDFQRVLKESKGGRAAKAEIEKKGKAYEASLKSQGEELEKLKKKLEAESMVMSKEMRETKERDFRIKVGDFKALQKKYAGEFKEFETDIIQRVQKEVFGLVEKIGKKGGYLMILEKSAILYYVDAIDITDEMIKQYDAIK